MNPVIKSVCMIMACLCSACDVSLNEFINPNPFDNSSGPLTRDEIQHFASNMHESLGDELADCIIEEATVRASSIGDPEMLDPNSVDLLPADHWTELDKSDKRVILAQVVFSQAGIQCTKKEGK